MPAKWIGFIVFVWIIGAMVGAVLEGSFISANETSVLNQLMGWQEITSQESWWPVKFIGALPDFFNGIFRLLTFDFAFFYGGWELVRLVLLAPIIATVVFGLIIMFFGLFSKEVS